MKQLSALAFLLVFFLKSMLFAQNELGKPVFFMEKDDFTLVDDPQLGPPMAGIITTPPPFEVRTMAEWEELSGLMIAWISYPDILAEIVRAALGEANVIILCKNAAAVTSAKAKLDQKGVDYSINVTFLITPFNSIWSRDYGPNNVYKNGVDSLLFVDWRYNRPTRPLDDAVPGVLGDFLGVPVYATTEDPTGIVNTGGNFMSDGMGTAFASKLILDENDDDNYGYTPKTEAEVDAVFQDFMGIDRYFKLETLPYDGINHIDMHIKLLDEETLLVSEYPAGVADGPQIEANLQYILNDLKTPFGEKYKVVRIPAPADFEGQFPNNPNGDYRTYTNAVFVNRTVILPTYEEKYDTTALRIWRESMPGYKIVGIPCNDIIQQLGAIHCITHEIGATEPVLINHHRSADCSISITDNKPYPIGAKIRTRTGVMTADVYFTNKPSDPSSWKILPMASVGIDSFSAEIPAFTAAVGDTLVYYIEARANSGKKMRRPMTAPEGFYRANFCKESSASTEPNLTKMADIFPNPASAMTCIPVFSNKKMRARLDLFDVNGRLVETIFSGEMPAGESKYFFNAGEFSTGVYAVRLQSDDRILTQKVVVK